VQRTNGITGEKFYGCSNWSRTQCSANPEHGNENREYDSDDWYWSAGVWRDWGDL